MQTEIEQLFDKKPELYTEEHFALFQRFKPGAERGRGARGGARRRRAQRMARECVGEERHSAGLPDGRHRRYVDRSQRGSRFSISQLSGEAVHVRRMACASCRAGPAFATAATSGKRRDLHAAHVSSMSGA